jgi:hypothetical protein
LLLLKKWKPILKKKIDTIIIDATEREYYRPCNDVEQSALFSGKQGYHTMKNTLFCDKSKYVHYLSFTTQGSIHDLELIRIEFNVTFNWFKKFNCIIDLGYLGFDKDYVTKSTLIPIKKPKNQQLTDDQKMYNKNVSSERIVIENSICGVKRFSSLVNRYRNKIFNFDDLIIRVATGIWNFHLLH